MRLEGSFSFPRLLSKSVPSYGSLGNDSYMYVLRMTHSLRNSYSVPGTEGPRVSDRASICILSDNEFG